MGSVTIPVPPTRHASSGKAAAKRSQHKPLPALTLEQREQVAQRVLRARIRLALQQPCSPCIPPPYIYKLQIIRILCSRQSFSLPQWG